MEFKHTPIMLNEVLTNLNIKPDGIYVDCTLGGAGHSLEIAKRLNEKGVLFGIDKDIDAINESKKRLADQKCKIILVHDDFKNLSKILKDNNLEKVDGILLDLGISSYQIDNTERGFSYSKDAPLDMRMNATQSLSAKEVVNNYDEKTLIEILQEYGEEKFAKSIVRNIINFRNKKKIETTGELVKIIENSVPTKLLHMGGSVAKKTFQAIRIEVNRELESLKMVLNNLTNLLNKDGRLCIITFHSLEDRLVKQNFIENATGCICPKTFPICVCSHKKAIEIITKKPITPSQQEQKENTRSQSSKLRVAKRI